MRLLADTHVLLWALAEPARLSSEARAALRDPAHELYASAASVWECAIKVSAGKLTLPGTVSEWLIGAVEELGITWMPITAAHAALVAEIELHHRDPFDRLLVAQARLEACTLVTHDRALAPYGVPILWS